MKKYRLINNVSGWVVFLVAAFTYLMTIEPTASLWDCGEFVASCFKLEVGHPPGNPVFGPCKCVYNSFPVLEYHPPGKKDSFKK